MFDFSGNGSEVRAGISYGFEVEFTTNRSARRHEMNEWDE